MDHVLSCRINIATLSLLIMFMCVARTSNIVVSIIVMVTFSY